MRFWLVVFIVLLMILDIIWMLDGFLNVQYGNILHGDSYTSQVTTFAYRLFADNPLKSLYYRIIISLLVFTSIIIIILFIGRLSYYRNLLDASNLRYKTLFMEMSSGFALRKIIREKDGKIKDIKFLEVNPAFRQQTGLTETEIAGKSIHEVFAEVDQELINEYDRIAHYGGSFTMIHKAAGLNKTLRITAYQHTEDVFATLVEDITKEKQIEDELVESIQLKTILLNTINEGVYYLDNEMNVIWANDRVRELLEVPDEKILNNKCYNLWYNRDKICENCPVQQALETRQTSKFEIINIKGKYFQLHSSPVFNTEQEIMGVVMTIYDLTDWKTALEKLKKKQEHLNLALEVGNMTAWEWNASDGMLSLEQPNILFNNLNKKWDLDELGRYMHPRDRKKFIDQKDAILKGEIKELRVEARIRTKPGKWTWFNLLGRITESDEENKPLKVIGVTYNIDSFKTIALKLKKTNDELTEFKNQLEIEVENRVAELREKDLLMIRQSRQAAMGEMIGNIAHQWRQPLNTIAVIVQDLIDAWDFGEINREYLTEKIDKSMSVISHMSNTIDDFRDFFLPDNQPMVFDLDKQIIKTINILKDMYANQGIKIVSRLEPCKLTSYAREFSQVLINILNNSKDALKERKILKPQINVTLSIQGDHALIEVQDNAGGIPVEIMDKIFDPYFTTKRDANGTGVGLYMSKTIVEKHMNGEITAENAEEGALFRLSFPTN